MRLNLNEGKMKMNIFSLKKASTKEKENPKSKNVSKRKMRSIKRTTQNAINYEAMMKNGVCYNGDNIYSAVLKFTDVNYQIARNEDQEAIWTKYMEILNSLGSESGIQLVIHNHTVDEEDFEKDILLKLKGDNFDKDRIEFNKVLKANINMGTNNIVTDKMFVFTTKMDDFDEALKDINFKGREFEERFKELGCNAHIMDGCERLETINNIFNPAKPFYFDYSKVNDTFTTKDAIAPTSFDFKKNMFMVGDRYCRCLWLKNYSTELSDKYINDLTKIEHNLVISFHMKSVARGEELPLIKSNIAGMELQKMQEQKKALRDGYDPDMIPMELKYSLDSAYDLLHDVQSMDQRLFICQFFIMLNCETEKELDDVTKQVLTRAKKYSTEMVVLDYQQEQCMNACLPLGQSKVYAGAGGKGRTLTSPVCGILIPFTSQELMQKGNSIYYGLNPTTSNLIMANRLELDNPSGWTLAKPGSGKSFAVKREIMQVILNTDDDVIIIDPENEYKPLTKRYNGSYINVSTTSGTYFNIFDGDDNEVNFLTEKAEFLQSVMAHILCVPNLSPQYVSVIDRTLRELWARYEQKVNDNKYVDIKKPTLDDFADLLAEQPSQEAKSLTLALGIYTKDGTYHLFSKESNVNMDNRLTTYNIRDLSEGLKTLGMFVILETLWTRIKRNFEAGKRTWIYIDEIYLMFANEYCINFFYTLWKRARKYGAILTGITQNVEDLLHNEKIGTLLSNSNFIMMLNQSSQDRDNLAKLLNLSPQMLSSITNAKKGSGLLQCGSAIIPFSDNFPKDNELYNILTSDFDEIVKLREINSQN
ncbi:VirB4-like conjugal transfer ATPase, CD1110 family [Thomasclavelia spiroformis]|uniref:VirB4-like conjugal transfer ATPase, CD1110 family n=1 Tax=Thomasclavelia spiroformis TaxID=29348 RepID=UPI003D162291